MTLIKIFKSRNDPLARLSNNFTQDMVIAGVKYRSVTNYVYSNMLRTSIYSNLMAKAKPHGKCTGPGNCRQIVSRGGKYTDKKLTTLKTECEKAGCNFSNLSVYEQYLELYEKENDNLIKESVDTSLEAKLSESETALQLLLSTNNRPITYISNNAFLGIGPHNNGKNEYGKALQAIRARFAIKNIQVISTENKRKMNIKKYNTYVAYTNLTTLLLSGDNLTEYVGMTSTEVLDKMKKAGFNIRKSPNQEMVVDEINRDKRGSNGKTWINEIVIIAISNPTTITDLVRGESLQKLQTRLKQKEKKLVLEMYMDYLLRKRFPDVKENKYEEARNQQLTTIDGKALFELETKVSQMYEKGMLSASLSDLIDAAKKTAPTSEEIETAEAMAASIKKSFSSNSENITPITTDGISGEDVFVYTGSDPNRKDDIYDILAPLDTTISIYIDGRSYPSISYYIMVKNLSVLYGMNIIKAYNIAKTEDTFKTIQELEGIINTIKYNSYSKEVKKYATIALRSKFQNRESQNTLLATGNDSLLWDDRKDVILGGNSNFVGKELEKIRQHIRLSRGTEDLDKLSTEDISKVFQNKFLMSWFRMRVRDMCNIIITMKDYMYDKYTIIQDLNSDFIGTVLDIVYQPCSHIFAAIDQIKVDPPLKFVSMVKSYHGCKDLNEESVNEIWKRLAVVIYYFINHLNDSTSVNIAVVLGRIERLTSRQKDCEFIIPNPEENCIFGAILNILKGIIIFSKKYGYSSKGIDVVEFDTALTILLNINSLSEQRALRLKKSGVKKAKPSINIEIVELTLKQEGYSDEIIYEVIEEIKRHGEIPKNVSQIAFSIKFKKDNSTGEKSVQLPDNDEGEEDVGDDVGDDLGDDVGDDLGDDLGDDVGDDEDGLGVFDEDTFDYNDDVIEEDTGPVMDPDIVDKIKSALKDVNVNPVDLVDNSLIFIVDESIRFVKDYPLASKIKTNRINFFASSAGN